MGKEQRGRTMEKKIAKYKIIENDLLNDIHNNKYLDGDLIPTELELSTKYQVSRVTVRRATDNLVAKGFLKRTAGLGTTVNLRPKTSSDLRVRGFNDQMKDLGKKVVSTVHTFNITSASPKKAQILGISEKDLIYYIERIRKADDKVYLFEISYISVDKFPELSIQYLQNSKYDFFRDVKNVTIDHQKHVVHPILSDDKISSILSIKKGTPIIMVENYTYCDDGTIIDFSYNYYNPDEYELCYIKSNT